MGDLSDDEVTLDVALSGHLLEGLEALALVGSADRDDRVSHGLQVVVLEHDVTGEVQADTASAPVLVDILEVLAGYAARLEVVRVPRGETLGHGALEEAIGGIAVGELEVQGLAQRRRVGLLRLVAGGRCRHSWKGVRCWVMQGCEAVGTNPGGRQRECLVLFVKTVDGRR
jgi:hypothetical protein